MDPLNCLLSAESALFGQVSRTQEERLAACAAASKALHNYDAWRRRGGFQPMNVTGQAMSDPTGDGFAKRLRQIIRIVRDTNVD
jgi:hypothetical protein